MTAPTPGSILRSLADLIDSGVAEVGSVTVMNDPASPFTGEKRVTASIMVSYPPDASDAPAIGSGA